MEKECFSVEVSLERFVSTDDERARVSLWLRRGSGRLGIHWQRLVRRLGLLIPGYHGCRRRIAALRAGALLHPRDPVEALLPGDIITLIAVPESWSGEWSGASDDEDALAPVDPAPASSHVVPKPVSISDTRLTNHSSSSPVIIPPAIFASNPDLLPTPVSCSPGLSCPSASPAATLPADPGRELAAPGGGGDTLDGLTLGEPVLGVMKRRALALLAAVAPAGQDAPPAPRRRRLRRRRRRGSRTQVNAAGDNTHSISDCYEINNVQAPMSPSHDSEPAGEDRSASEANETSSDIAGESTAGRAVVQDAASASANDTADEAPAEAARGVVLRGGRRGEAPRRVAAL